MRIHIIFSRLSIGLLGFSSFVSCTNCIQSTGVGQRYEEYELQHQKFDQHSEVTMEDNYTRADICKYSYKWALIGLGCGTFLGLLYSATFIEPGSISPLYNATKPSAMLLTRLLGYK